MLLEVIWLLVGIALLYWGAERLVRHSSWLAKSIGVSTLVIGLTVVAFGTSAPELLVSANASLQGDTDIALGNVIGSNIANIGLILGLVVLIWPPKHEESTIKREFPLLLIATILLFLLALDGVFGQIDGIVFLILFTLFIWYNFRTIRRGMADAFVHEVEEVEEVLAHKKHVRDVWRNVILAIVGLGALLVGSEFLVDSASSIATTLGVSPIVIGVSLVALGTSLPELITSVIASIKREESISVGMILGSNIFNTLLILGVAAVIHPIGISRSIAFVSIPIMFFFTLLVFPILKKEIRTFRILGLFMILGYFGFIFYSFFS